jgi:putative aminopeptidase FrvX
MAEHERLRALLRQFTAVAGISGHEDAMAAAFARALAEAAAETRIDALSNVIVRLQGEPRAEGKRIALVAHLDTVGLMVKRHIAPGLLGVIGVGGVNLKAASGAAVRVGEQAGLIGVRSQHQARAGEVIPAQEDLVVEIGAGDLPPVTTPISFAPQTVEMGGGLYASPALDDRAGCAVLVEVARRIAGRTPHEIYVIGSAQEETTCSGALAALADIRPDAAIFVDGTLSYDTPETRAYGEVALGRGPVLVDFLYTSGLNGWHAHPGLKAHLANVARAEAIAVQHDAAHGLMSDARTAQALALPSALVGLPTRGKHGPLETIHLDDLAAAADLLAACLTQPIAPLTRGE